MYILILYIIICIYKNNYNARDLQKSTYTDLFEPLIIRGKIQIQYNVNRTFVLVRGSYNNYNNFSIQQIVSKASDLCLYHCIFRRVGGSPRKQRGSRGVYVVGISCVMNTLNVANVRRCTTMYWLELTMSAMGIYRGKADGKLGSKAGRRANR